jgi:hypothetical protein
MATFTSDVLKSQQSQDPNAVNKLNKELQDAQNAMRRMQGGGEATVNPFNTAPQQAWGAQEQQRRQQAASGASQVAGQIDERTAGAQNKLASIYDKYNATNANSAQQQAQQQATTDFEVQSGMSQVKQSRDKFDFSMYQNQSQRDDALQAAWTQGLAEDKMMDAAISHNMKLQDIDKYFALLANALNQELEDWKQTSSIDWEQKKRDIETKASNTSSILSGLLGIVGGVVGTYYGGATGAAVGSKIGSAVGSGIAGVTQ